MADTPTELLLEVAKTLPGHGAASFKVFDTKSKKATLVKAKLQSKELVLLLDTFNEEDIVAHSKTKRGTKDYARFVLDKMTVGFKEGELRLDFDWTGIRRLQVEAAQRAEKLAEKKKRDEEDKIAKEIRLEEEKRAEQARVIAHQQAEARRIQAEKDAELLRIKREKEEREREAVEKRRAFEDKIGNAILNGGVLTHIPKKDIGDGKDDAAMPENVAKTWSDEHRSFYFTDVDTNVLTWRDPRIVSVWEKLWDLEMKAFKFVNKQTSETIWEEPYTLRIEKVWVEDEKKWYYVDRESGDTQTNEPYY